MNSFLTDSSKRNYNENYNLIVNLKCLYYFEAPSSSKNQTNNSLSNSFVNTLTFNLKVILNFFIEKFNVLVSIFFSNDCMLEVLTKERKYEEMDKVFEDYLFGSKTGSQNNVTKSTNKMDIDEEDSVRSKLFFYFYY